MPYVILSPFLSFCHIIVSDKLNDFTVPTDPTIFVFIQKKNANFFFFCVHARYYFVVDLPLPVSPVLFCRVFLRSNGYLTSLVQQTEVFFFLRSFSFSFQASFFRYKGLVLRRLKSILWEFPEGYCTSLIFHHAEFWGIVGVYQWPAQVSSAFDMEPRVDSATWLRRTTLDFFFFWWTPSGYK